MKIRWFFLTLGYSGLSPKYPAIISSVISFLIALPILMYFGSQTLIMLAILISIITIKQIDIYAKENNYNDDRIVIDKLIGIFIALSIAPAIPLQADQLFNISNAFLIQALMSLVFYIFFNIKKPSIIGRIAREAKGSYAVVGDDIMAGVTSGMLTAVIYQSYISLLN